MKFINGYFPSCLDENLQFNLAYLVAIDYVLNDKAYSDLLKSVKAYGVSNLLLVQLSVYNPTLYNTLNYFRRLLLAKFNMLNEQYWGYLRTVKEHLIIFEKAGFSQIEHGWLDSNKTYYIKANLK